LKQVDLIANDKASIEQANAQLTNQVSNLNSQISQLVIDKQTVQVKLDSVQSALNQPLVNETGAIQIN